MLLAASHSLLNLGVRPRAVTTPVRIRSSSGTWCGRSSAIKDQGRKTRAPIPIPKTTSSPVQKAHHFSTVHTPRLSRRSNLASVVAAVPPFMPGESCAGIGRQTRGGTSGSESNSLPHPLRDVQAQVQGQQPLAPVSDTPPGTKPDQSPLSPDDQRVTLVPSLLLMPTVEHQSQMAVQAAPDVIPSTCVNVNVSGNVTGSNLCVSATAAATATQEVPEPPRRPARPESPLAHARRSAGPNHVPPARIETVTSPGPGTVTGVGSEYYRLSIALPRPGGALLASEMITVSARRGGRLAVVADAWHLEHDCHYEWHVAFPQSDIDMSAVRARIDGDGILVIDLPRR